MKILQFTLPIPDNKTIITKEESLPHFYPHLHRHNEVQLTWIIKGEGTLVAGNSMQGFQGNEIYWLGANQPHVFKSEAWYFESKGKNKTHKVDIFFNFETGLSGFFSIPEVNQLKEFVQQHQSGFRVPQALVPGIAEKIRLVRKTTGIEQFLHFVEILRQLSECGPLKALSTHSASISYSDNEGIRLATIYNYIMQHFSQQISLKEVADLACMTPEAFCRYFKKHTHHTLVSFVNEVRINEACKTLVENRFDSIASIAYNTGFNSITNFNRVFKSVIKKSPKNYLESYRHVNQASIPA